MNKFHWILMSTVAFSIAGCGNSSLPGGGNSGGIGVAGARLHVDCAAADGGDGSLALPWNSLEQANQAQLVPGDQLLLRRGTVCVGMLEPQGSGTAAKPVVIGAYGDGPLPRIEAQGLKPAALQLTDLSHLIAQDLELTNQGNATERHRGVYITARNTVVRDVTVRRLFVHHVDGPVEFTHHDKLGGGIILENLGTSPKSSFQGVLIEANRVEDVARSGIFLDGGPSTARPRATEPWPEAATGIVVRNNRLKRLAGDGIVPVGTLDAIVEDNVVSFGNRAGRSIFDPAGPNCSAGIWTFNANRTLIQRNEVFGFQSSCDGTGYDIDYNQDGTIFQFNYSHDNEGGFMLLCTDDLPRTAEVRYNLSVNDAYIFNQAPCKLTGGQAGTLDGIRVYNNTFITPTSALSNQSPVPLPVLPVAGSFEFQNNIVYATSQQLLPFPCGDHCSYNLFFNLPASGVNAITADPLFEDFSRRGEGRRDIGQGFQLRPGSPAINAGTHTPGTVQTDYFGNAVSTDRAPTIGFHQPIVSTP